MSEKAFFIFGKNSELNNSDCGALKMLATVVFILDYELCIVNIIVEMK